MVNSLYHMGTSLSHIRIIPFIREKIKNQPTGDGGPPAAKEALPPWILRQGGTRLPGPWQISSVWLAFAVEMQVFALPGPELFQDAAEVHQIYNESADRYAGGETHNEAVESFWNEIGNFCDFQKDVG